jgi:Chitin binding Peritrophin-A domain
MASIFPGNFQLNIELMTYLADELIQSTGADGVDVSLQQPPMMSQQPAAVQTAPVATVERTNMTCLPDALARLPDRLYCNKYYVCSNGTYVGQFCPTGMAFDYGQQTCRLRQEVRCLKRPLICQ